VGQAGLFSAKVTDLSINAHDIDVRKIASSRMMTILNPLNVGSTQRNRILHWVDDFRSWSLETIDARAATWIVLCQAAKTRIGASRGDYVS
jgi:hypothetical protein